MRGLMGFTLPLCWDSWDPYHSGPGCLLSLFLDDYYFRRTLRVNVVQMTTARSAILSQAVVARICFRKAWRRSRLVPPAALLPLVDRPLYLVSRTQHRRKRTMPSPPRHQYWPTYMNRSRTVEVLRSSLDLPPERAFLAHMDPQSERVRSVVLLQREPFPRLAVFDITQGRFEHCSVARLYLLVHT